VGRLSSGAAAILAGISRTLFLTKLGDYGVSTFNLTKEELERDFESA
jgi:predicted HTH domain antitoxin